jgi:hypothetical protein
LDPHGKSPRKYSEDNAYIRDRPVENGSVTGPLLSVTEYALQVIKKMQRDHIKSWVPKQDVTDRFNEHAQEWIKHTVWKSECRSWYRNNETGRVNGEYSLRERNIPLLTRV